MTLIKSISGIRGTIGGATSKGLTPLDIVKFTSAYATLIRRTCTIKNNKIVVGRDARLSGPMVRNVVVGTLMGMGWDVIDIDLATTPTTELAVTMEGASGGIILTASHNPKQWNALKLLNEKGEFLNKEEGNEVLRIAEAEDFDYAEVDKLGTCKIDLSYNQKHIDAVLALPLVDVEAIRKAHFRVAIDTVNSVGGIILPELLTAERPGVPGGAEGALRTGLVSGLRPGGAGPGRGCPFPAPRSDRDLRALPAHVLAAEDEEGSGCTRWAAARGEAQGAPGRCGGARTPRPRLPRDRTGG